MGFLILRWFLWILGVASSCFILVSMLGVKMMSGWFFFLFLAASIYCIGAQIAVFIIRDRAPGSKFVSALSTSRPGLIILFAFSLFMIVMILLWR
jgi:hypothetical protein